MTETQLTLGVPFVFIFGFGPYPMVPRTGCELRDYPGWARGAYSVIRDQTLVVLLLYCCSGPWEPISERPGQPLMVRSQTLTMTVANAAGCPALSFCR